jgi:MFS family permease
MVVLTTVNFLNYIDRYVLAAILDGVGASFGLDDKEGGLLISIFVVVYMLASPITGALGDRVTRKYLVAGGIGLWSLATVGSGLANSYGEMLFMRALVGIGEAGYAAVAPAIIADLYTEDRRGRMLSYFYLAIPMGSAMGFGLGGAVAQHYEAVLSFVGMAGATDEGWRVALCVAGAPGLLMALAAAFMHEPVRGQSDGPQAQGSGASSASIADGVRALFANRAWRIDTVGMTFMTFAIGGIGAWMPTYLQRAFDMSEGAAGMQFGAVTVVGGLFGTLIGGWLGDRAQAKGAGGYFRVSGIGLACGAPFVLAMPWLDSSTLVLALAFFAEFFLFLNTGPLNAALVNCVGPHLRASAVALNVLFIHALGDAISPPLMGWISDLMGGGGQGLGVAIASTSLPLVAGAAVLMYGAKVVDAQSQGLRGS